MGKLEKNFGNTNLQEIYNKVSTTNKYGKNYDHFGLEAKFEELSDEMINFIIRDRNWEALGDILKVFIHA